MKKALGTLLALILGAAAISPAWAADPTFVQSGGDADGGVQDYTISFLSAVTAGNYLSLFLRVDHGVTVSSVVFPGSQSPTLLDSCTASCAGSKDYYLYRVMSATGGGTDITFHVSTTGTVVFAGIEIANVGSEVAYANFATMTAATTQTCPATTATAANQMAVSYFGINFAGSPAPANGETEIYDNNRNQVEEKMTSGSGSVANQVTVNAATAGECAQVLLGGTANAPTFTSNPAIGTRTTSSIPILATSACTDCTLYGVAYTDGLAEPTCSQIQAGEDVNSAAAYSSFSAAMTANVQVTGTFSSYTDGTKRDSAYCMHSTANGDSAVFALADIDKIPVSSCSFSSGVNGSITYSCTLDGAGTIYIVACLYNSTHATVSEVEAAHCTGGIAAEAAANRSGTGSLTVGSTLPFPIYDISYVAIYNFGSQHEAATHTDLARYQAPPTGFQYVTLASVTTAGSVPKAYNDAAYITIPYDTQTANFHVGDLVVDTISGAWGFILVDGDSGAAGTLTVYKKSGTFSDNDSIRDSQGGAALVNGSTGSATKIAVADIIEVPDHVSPGGDSSSCPGDPACLTVDTNGQYSYTASGRQTVLNGLIYDVSASGWMALDLDVYFNNTAPSCSSPIVIVAKTNVVMTTRQLSLLCNDDDNETIHYAIVSGADPAGLSLDWTSGDYAGTPTVENESGVVLTVVVYDAAGDYGTQTITVYPITTWTLGDYTNFTQSAAENAIDALGHGAIFVGTSNATDPVIVSGNVISQSPAAGAEIAPFDTETLILSIGPVSSGSGSQNTYIGIRIGVGL